MPCFDLLEIDLAGSYSKVIYVHKIALKRIIKAPFISFFIMDPIAPNLRKITTFSAPVNIQFETLGNEPNELDLEANASELQELAETGGTGKVAVHLDVTPMSDGIYLVRGVARGTLSPECGRCLDKLEETFKTKFNLLINKRKEKGLEWLEDDEQGVEDYQVRVGPDVFDIPLDHIIAEQVILNYNLHPLPDLDARNNCVKCGRSAVMAEEKKTADRVDPRWATLEALKKVSKDKAE